MELNKQVIIEERITRIYLVGGKEFIPQIINRNGKFSHFTLNKENGFKVKYTLQLDAEDEEVFNVLKDFFKSLD